jgi:formylglycine-generating enzyme
MKALGRLAFMMGALTWSALQAHAAPARDSCAASRAEVFVPAGRYAPFFKRARPREPVRVEAMCLGAAPVTNAEYLDFVRAHPEWRRSRVAELFAEDSYLADWRDDLSPPEDALAKPVTYVSWFAAGAFCEAQGARLPNVAEWERFAGAAPPQPSATGGAARAAAPFEFAMGHLPRDLAASRIQLAGIWEWTGDFNSSVVSGRIGNAQGTDASLFCGDGFRAVDPSNYAAFLRYSFRSSLRGDFALRNLGFRCTREAT